MRTPRSRTTTVVILGAGQAGLAMSRRLSERSIDHVLLERRAVAASWRTERWDSLRLLTPNWLSRLPGQHYSGPDPDGYMTADEVVGFLAGYASNIAAPVCAGTTVQHVRTTSTGYRVETDQGDWACRAVVIATGACSNPYIPPLADELPPWIEQISPIQYRNPSQLDDGPVLVVGASASGAQLADELVRSGRRVTLAVGDHVRLPRTYRGRDIHWWLDALGVLDERFDEVPDLSRARQLPSLQLVGTPQRRTLDLDAMQAAGVEIVGRLAGVREGRAQLSGSLSSVVTSADLKLERLLDRIDELAERDDLAADIGEPDRPPRTTLPPVTTELDLTPFRTVVWATGFRPQYPWLEDHLLDARGRIVHDGGVLAQPGLYVLGLPFTRRRKSSFLDGVGPDSADLAEHLATLLDIHASAA